MFSSRRRYDIKAARDHSALFDVIDYDFDCVSAELDNNLEQNPIRSLNILFEKIDQATENDGPCHFGRNWVDLVSGKQQDILSELVHVVSRVSTIVSERKDKVKKVSTASIMDIRFQLLTAIRSRFGSDTIVSHIPTVEKRPEIEAPSLNKTILNAFHYASKALIQNDVQTAMVYVTIADIILGVVRYRQWVDKQ